MASADEERVSDLRSYNVFKHCYVYPGAYCLSSAVVSNTSSVFAELAHSTGSILALFKEYTL